MSSWYSRIKKASSVYGYWLLPDGQLIEVGEFGHEAYLRQSIDILKDEAGYTTKSPEDILKLAYDIGWAKITMAQKMFASMWVEYKKPLSQKQIQIASELIWQSYKNFPGKRDYKIWKHRTLLADTDNPKEAIAALYQ